MLRLALLAFVSLFLAGSVPTAEARPVAKKSSKAKAKPAAKKKAVAKKAKTTKRKSDDDDDKPREPRRPMP